MDCFTPPSGLRSASIVCEVAVPTPLSQNIGEPLASAFTRKAATPDFERDGRQDDRGATYHTGRAVGRFTLRA